VKYLLCALGIFFVCSNQAMECQKKVSAKTILRPGTPVHATSDQLKSYAELGRSPRELEPVVVRQGNHFFWGAVREKMTDTQYKVVHQENGNRAKGAIHTRDTLYKLKKGD